MATKKSNSSKAFPNWNLFIGLVKFTLLVIVMAFGYLLLENDIQEWINRKPLPIGDINKRNRSTVSDDADWNKVVNGIHVRSGLHADPNLQTIIGACTSCHSSKLITQNKATREGWEQMIRWMQKTQNLGDLGKNEPIILDYLAKYYAPKKEGRRQNIDMEAIEWYVLSLDE